MKDFKIGYYTPGDGYRSFVPEVIDRRWSVNDPALLMKLSKADRYVGRLDSFSNLVNIDLFVRMPVAKEATLSSKIEGTRTEITEALMDREDIKVEQRDDWEEVQHYIQAMQRAMELRHELPFSLA